MNKMSKKTEYALMALNLFHSLEQQGSGARPQSPKPLHPAISAKDIAEKIHAPFEITARVLQVLASKGILKAEYGTQGGYHLVKSLDEVSVHDLIETLESSTELTKCIGSESECDLAKKCTIVAPITTLNKKIQNFYKSISISEVLNV